MKRRFFQIHLLTALIAMFVVAGLLWVNMWVTRVNTVNGSLWIEHETIYLHTEQLNYFGWPSILGGEMRISPTPKMDRTFFPTLWQHISMPRKEFNQLIRSGTRYGVDLKNFQQQFPEIAARLDQTEINKPPDYSMLYADLDTHALLINMSAAMGLLFVVTASLESILRHRERSKI